jgi:hypothetical protein
MLVRCGVPAGAEPIWQESCTLMNRCNPLGMRNGGPFGRIPADLSHIDALSFSRTNRQVDCAVLTISLQLLRFRFRPTLLL